MKKLYLIGLVFIFFLAFSVNGSDLTDNIAYWNFDNNVLDTEENYDLTNNNAIYTVNGKINGAYDYETTSSSNMLYEGEINGVASINLWVNLESNNIDQVLLAQRSSTGSLDGWYFRIDDTGELHILDDIGTASKHCYSDTLTWNTEQDYMISFVIDGSSSKFYRNNVAVNMGSCDITNTVKLTDPAVPSKFGIGADNNFNTGYFDGIIDEVLLTSNKLSTSDLSELYNSGNGYNPYITPITEVNDSSESTAVVKQIGTTSFIGETTIVSNTFNVSVNNAPMYGGYSFNVETNGANILTCDLEIDGNIEATVSRSNIKNTLGSVFIQTPLLYLDNSTSHTQELLCRRNSGVGLITISEAVGIGHFLVDEDNNILNNNETIFNKNINSGNSFSLIDTFDITVSNKSSDDQYNSIVLEGALTYTNVAGTNEELATYMTINGNNCSTNNRDVNSGNTGSVTTDCILENATTNQTYTINLYGNGTNAQYIGNIIAKNLFIADEEIAGGTGILKDYVFTGNTDTKIFNLTGGNLNHDLANVFQKIGYSVKTDTDTEVNFWVKIIDGDTYTTKNFTREFETGKIGFLTGHDILENVPKDPDYQIELWANCGTIGATCNITGGSSLGYITDVTTTVLNGFEIYAHNNYTSESIQNFTVSNGAVYNTTTGMVEFFTSETTENITISSDGYFDLVVEVNTNKTYNASLIAHPIVKIYDTYNEMVLSNFSVIVNGINYSTTTDELSVPYNDTVGILYREGYYSRQIELNQSQYLNNSINPYTKIYANSYPLGNIINNFTVDYVNTINFLDTGSVSTTNGVASIPIFNGSYIVTLKPDDYAYTNVTLSPAPYLQNFTFDSIQEAKSLLVNFIDIVTQSVINNVVLELISESYANNYSTSDGTLFIQDLSSDRYTARYSSDGYVTDYYIFSIAENYAQNLTLYMNPDNNDTIVKEIQVIDLTGKPVSGATVKSLRYNLATNQYQTLTISDTNSDGYTYHYLTFNDEYFKFIVEYEGETKLITEPEIIYSSDTTTLQIDTGTKTLASFYNDFINLDYDLSFNTNTNNIVFTYNQLFTIGTEACLTLYDTTYGDRTQISSSCSTSSGNTLSLPVTDLNKSYEAQAIYLYNDEYYFIDMLNILPDNEAEDFGTNLFIFQIIITLLILGIASIGGAEMILITLPLSLIIGRMLQFNFFTYTSLFIIQVVFIIIAYLVYKER